jgi:hypothetical protein
MGHLFVCRAIFLNLAESLHAGHGRAPLSSGFGPQTEGTAVGPERSGKPPSKASQGAFHGQSRHPILLVSVKLIREFRVRTDFTSPCCLSR